MLSVPRTILFSFLSVMILAAFVVAIPTAVLPVKGQVISDDWKYEIESYLQEVDTNTTAEIVVYVVDSLFGHGIGNDGNEINDIFQLGVYIFNELPLDTPSGSVVGIGKKGKDNGVLVLVAIADREWRIEVGYGLEGYITDVESYRIAEDYLVPNFGEGEYGKGLAYTVKALSLEIPNVTEAEQMPTRGRYVYDNAEPPADEEIPWWVIALIVIFVIVMISVVGRFGGGRRGRSWGGSRGGGERSGGGGGGGRSGGGGSGGRW
ncbi:TPM domain-containing protein [bacterium]|nr:MAG: TPM domain-containing protein [bacterium]